MAKGTGLGDNCYVGGYDISGDVGELSRIGGGPALLPVTGIDKSAFERLGGKRDGGLAFSSFFNDEALFEHVALSPLPTADVLVSYYRGTTLGNRAASCIAKQVNYDPDRGDDGALVFSVEALANSFGLEWGTMLTAGTKTDTGAANGTGVDGDLSGSSGSTSFGLQAYLHVMSFTGTDATIKLQESSDDASGDAYADVTGGGFTQVSSAPVTERIATGAALTVEQWLRAITTTSAGFSEMTFAVMVVRNIATPVF